MPGLKRFRKKHYRQDADRIAGAYPRSGLVQRPQHSRRPGRIQKAPWLRARRATSVSVPDGLGISGIDWNSARNAAPGVGEEDRLSARTPIAARASPRCRWVLFEGDASTDSSHRGAN